MPGDADPDKVTVSSIMPQLCSEAPVSQPSPSPSHLIRFYKTSIKTSSNKIIPKQGGFSSVVDAIKVSSSAIKHHGEGGGRQSKEDEPRSEEHPHASSWHPLQI